MSINHLIFQNMKKNFKHYYLYVFALIFTVALYFAFVTLQFDPALDEAKGTIKGAASMKAASILLLGIVSIFLLYANNIFIKKRSKEIGLFQLIGMRKPKIFFILTIENLMLYLFSLIIGIAIGFSASRFFMLILFKVTDVEAEAALRFSSEAFVQTLIVFAVIYLFIMLLNYLFIKKQTILSLFTVRSSTEEKHKKVSLFEMIYGMFGILLILFGYYVSTKLFGGDFVTVNELLLAMITILASVIFGTYLFYKGSVRFIFYLIRKKKGGYLNISEVLSLSTIMFRMKSNALFLTIITTVSALSIGLLSLCYISLYSSEKVASNYVAADFSFTSQQDADQFVQALDSEDISYELKKIEVFQANSHVGDIMETKLDEAGLSFDPTSMQVAVISDTSTQQIDLKEDEVLLASMDGFIQSFLAFKKSGTIELEGLNVTYPLRYLGIEDDYYVARYFTSGGVPLTIVDESVFKQLQQDLDPALQKESSLHIGITVANKDQLVKANEHYGELSFQSNSNSRLDISKDQKISMGLVMFIVGFLGLSFLITSGCILYFKQVDESEDEKPNYTILRKLGFTQGDLLKGIQVKQMFNFGIPLLIGLSHSYFAVKSGWFMFGTELWTPMIIVMLLYTALYSIFGLLSVLYYKKVISESLK